MPATAAHRDTRTLQQRLAGLLRQHRDRVYGYAYHFLGNSADAEDVTQEVFIRLWHHLETLEADRVQSWILRVARNACIDLLRSRKSSQSLFSTGFDGLEELKDCQPGPDVDVESAEFQEHLRRALERLSEPYRSILIFREIQDMKYEDIAQTLDLPLNTVKVYLHRARRALRETLVEVSHRAIA